MGMNKKTFAALAKNWWLPLVEGILSILAGIYTISNFGLGFEVVSVMVAAFLTTSGVVGLVGALTGGDYEGKVLTVILSIIRMIAGMLLVVMPGMAEMMLIILTGTAFLTHAINTVVFSIFMKKGGLDGWVAVLILGILLIINAFIIIADPFLSIALISGAVSADLLITGVHDIILAFQMKKLKNALKA